MIIITVSSCEKTSPIDQAGLQPDMLVKNFTTSSHEDGRLVWEISAAESSYYYGENRSIAKNIILKYYEDNKISATVSADTAEISLDTNDIKLSGNIDMISTSGNRLLTGRISWSSKNRLLETDDRIKIIKKNGDTIEGTGLKADYKLEYYEIKSKVKAITKNAGNEKSKNK
jgi:LPS export ABC transporter protein LptC